MPRVQRVAQAVAQEIECEHGQGQGQRREHNLVRIRAQRLGALGNHRAPARRRRVYTKDR